MLLKPPKYAKHANYLTSIECVLHQYVACRIQYRMYTAVLTQQLRTILKCVSRITVKQCHLQVGHAVSCVRG